MKSAALLPVILLSALSVLPAPAAPPAAAGKSAPCNAPIKVDADTFLADLNSKAGTYSGNVVVSQCDIRMHADSVRVNLVNDKPDKIYAKGHVLVDSPSSGTATGDDGVYDVAPRLVTLTGHVVLTRGKDVMRGARLTVNLVSGQAQLGAPGAPGGRVQGLFTPPPQTPSQTSQQAPAQTPNSGSRQ